MRNNKSHPTIGCCGIDCGLCPRYHTEGKSKCPGFYGINFLEVMVHTCSFINCCFKNKKIETCGECNEFPCKKFNSKWFGNNAYDSFVTYKKAMLNLYLIKNYGFEKFLKQQIKRMKYLNRMLKEFNDGRSKNLFCLSSALLSIERLTNAIKHAREIICVEKTPENDTKTKAKIIKNCFFEEAEKESVELCLNKPPNWK